MTQVCKFPYTSDIECTEPICDCPMDGLRMWTEAEINALIANAVDKAIQPLWKQVFQSQHIRAF